jgi:hypothetical protein
MCSFLVATIWYPYVITYFATYMSIHYRIVNLEYSPHLHPTGHFDESHCNDDCLCFRQAIDLFDSPRMNSIYTALLALCLATSAYSFILGPNILNPNIRSNRTVCQDDQLEGAYDGEPEQLVGPYLFCVNGARLIIHQAFLEESVRAKCPLQYVGAGRGQVCDVQSTPRPVDVTLELKERCDGFEECYFSFDTIFPRLSCRNDHYGNNEYSRPNMISRDYQLVNVEHQCETARPRFRPFANKKYDSKFSRNIMHPYRKLSYNHLQSL